jgi:biopolymer transport protein ExbB/TolQ
MNDIMGILIATIIVMIGIVAIVFVSCACVLSGRVSRQEEDWECKEYKK